MSDPYEDLGNARSTGRRPKPTPPAKPWRDKKPPRREPRGLEV